MSIHKLTAGSGYDYLTRQVAACDATDKGHTGLASYYTARGETPGVWAGAGMAGIDGLAAENQVTAAQMQALFGSGHHPLAAQRRAALEATLEANGDRPNAATPSDADYRAATRLGVPYRVYDRDVSAFRVEVARRVAAVNAADGLPGDWPVPADVRARVRTEVAAEFFAAEHGRQPADAREIAAVIAKHSRPKTTAVAGYDLTFSPVKSVSALWAVADPATAARVERAHQAAVADALRFLESHALFTRTGTNGVRQVDVQGLVAAAFTHRDSRAGDPDLHTHVAVANKVQTDDGRWLAIDGRVLFKANVAASETYNTALEKHLVEALGVRFEERPNPDARKRSVREIVGVDPALTARWSARRASIETRRGELAAAFHTTHGRPPTPVESMQLAQQATLETREAKHEPRTLAEQRSTWHTQAVAVLGSSRRLRKMLDRTLSPGPAEVVVADAAWFTSAAGRVLAAMEQRRSTWQTWHVRAEAQRQIRATATPAHQVGPLVDALVDEVLQTRSISLAPPPDGIEEPAPLRRADGASVYTVAGADLFTSARVVDAERRLVATAGQVGGAVVDPRCVELALLKSTANGLTLNAGQAGLVRQMAASGARLQLAIAPAGSGKTTAMRALATAWGEGGGTVVGLAPSAAAAAALGESLGHSAAARTDTLAKLTWSLATGDRPGWMERIGPSTLVVIDEAGMADTLSLDTAVRHIVGRGGSVRLVGDDQQLAAIGAGGVLRDIEASHGAVRLSELTRFADPAEGAATLALRDGHPEALGFYLDHHRVHVGDLATMTEDVFAGWQADRARGLDAVMLAPTRELTAELNRRARAHRIEGSAPSPTRRLGDGNDASVGELIITRANDRRLRTSATDWVKNGDRWTILALHHSGDLTVQHTQTGRTVRLPADYVGEATELGYASTVHTAQGVTADTMHGLASGGESRQQLYTMLTRGRLGNHVYLQVVGDGDPHSMIRPEVVHPPTATDLLANILARDDAPRSATTLLRDQADSTTRLGDAAARYLDALYSAAAEVAGTDVTETLDATAESVVPGLAGQAAWPPLRAHLLLLAAHGEDPLTQLRAAAGEGQLATAADTAAVLDWRLDETGLRNAGPGPLPWMPAIPPALADHPRWGGYLRQRAQLVEALAEEVAEHARVADRVPTWAPNGTRPGPATLAEIAVWRAATGVDPGDRRPTGPTQLQKAAAAWQHKLNRRVTGDHTPALREWGDLLRSLSPAIGRDDFTPLLADRLAAMSRAGLDTPRLLHHATTARGPLPDDHPAAALWWRLSRHLSPAVATHLNADDHTLTTAWTPQLADLVGADRAATLQASSWWPALVTTLDHGLARGWRLADLLTPQPPDAADGGDIDEYDECQALVWRASVLLDPPPDDHGVHVDQDDYDPPPDDLWHGVDPPADAPTATEAAKLHADQSPSIRPTAVGVAASHLKEVPPVAAQIDAELKLAAAARDLQVPPEPTDADTARMLARAAEWDHCPVTRQRMLEINELAHAFFTDHFADSWGRTYLADRFGLDLHGNHDYRPGHAPAGWTGLVHHLRRHGVTDTEMVATGVASTARTGRLIDRFRDRAIFPILHRGEILGFVGRRHPDRTEDDNVGPKYLNTADTPLFHKGAQLFGGDQLLDGSAVPTLVEGPIDAIAVTLATAGTHVGLAPLGTSLTDDQAAQLGHLRRDPVLATDADLAGRIAAEKAFWMLTPHGLDPSYARFPTDSDPADLLAHRGPAALAAALVTAHPLGEELVSERLTNLPPHHARNAAARVLAARPAHAWDPGVADIGDRLHISADQIRADLHHAVIAWDRDPRNTAHEASGDLPHVRQRLTDADRQPPAQRWASLGAQLDCRLPVQDDWPACATIMQDAHDQGHDVAPACRRLLAQAPLGPRPAQDLRYRLVSRLDVDLATDIPRTRPAAACRTTHERQTPPVPASSPDIRPRR